MSTKGGRHYIEVHVGSFRLEIKPSISFLNCVLLFLTASLTKKKKIAILTLQTIERKIYMYRKNDIQLAAKIVKLDLLRDELYEELMKQLGSKAPELLRKVQNQ